MATEVTQRRKRKRQKRVAVGALALVCAGGLLGWYQVHSTQIAIREEVAKLRALGAFVSADQIAEETQVPFQENAARALSGAQSLMDAASTEASIRKIKSEPTKSNLLSGILDGKLPKADLDKLTEDIEMRARALDAYREASKFPKLCFPRDYSLAWTTRFTELSPIKSAANYLEDDAVLSVKEGNWVRAEDDLVAAARLSALLKQDISYISGLVHLSVRQRVFSTTTLIFSRNWQDPRAMQLAKHVLDAAGEPATLAHMLRIESLSTIQLPEEVRSIKPSAFLGTSTDDDNSFRWLAAPGVLETVQLEALRQARRQLEVANTLGTNTKDLHDALLKLDRNNSRTGVISSLASLFTPTFVGGPDVIATDVATQRVLQECMGAAEYRKAHGVWPASPPLALRDPFVELPLKFNFTGGVFHVWSVGRNRIDDLGERTTDFSVPEEKRKDDIGAKLGP